MGLFKNLGNAVKKGVKQISLKNLVKVGTPLLGAIPIFGGMTQGVVQNFSDANEAKKQAKIAKEQGRIADAYALEQQAQYLATMAGQTAGSAVGSIGSKSLKAFSKTVTNELVASAPETFKEVTGIAGASLVDSTIKEWFKKHWLKLAIVFGILSAYFVWKKTTSNIRPTNNRRK